MISTRGRRHYSEVVGHLTTALQHAHAVSGLPWWAMIPVTTVALRTTWTLPLAIMQRHRIRKQNLLRPLVAATGPVIRLKLAQRAQKANREAAANPTVAAQMAPARQMKYEEIMLLSAKETRRRQKRLFRENGVQLWKNMLLPAAQIPLWVAMLATFRDLSGWASWELGKPLDLTLYSEGLWWFTDLTVLDQLHIFPLALGVVALVNTEWTFKMWTMLRNSRTLRPTLSDAMANLLRMAVVFLMAVSLHAPTALTIYWFSSQAYSLVQNVIMDLVLPINYAPNR